MEASQVRGNFNYPTAYRLGAGRVVELASACRELAIARPLVVTDSGVAALPFLINATKLACVGSQVPDPANRCAITAGETFATSARALMMDVCATPTRNAPVSSLLNTSR